MPNPNPNAQPPKGDGKDGGSVDPWESLKGQKDANGIPKHPEEKAEFYKNRNNESASEASRIILENKSLQEENEKLKNKVSQSPQGNAPYTTPELSANIPDFGLLTPQQQTAILNSYSSMHQDMESLKEMVAKIVDKQDFDKGYNALILDSQFAGLKDYKEEFIAKSYEEENLKTPLRTLAIAFLAEKGKWGNPPASASVDKDNPDEGRSGLDDGNAPNQAPPADKNTYTSEEAKELRNTDPKKYMRLIQNKKLIIKD